MTAGEHYIWTFLLVNLLIMASTVALGQHYLVDVPAGLLVGLVVVVLPLPWSDGAPCF